VQLSQDWSYAYQLNHEIISAVSQAYEPFRARAVAAVQTLAKQVYAVRDILTRYGIEGKNPYGSWLKQGAKISWTFQSPWGKKRGIAPAITITGAEKKNADGSYQHSIAVSGWLGTDDRLTEWKKRYPFLSLKDLAPGQRLVVGSTTGAASAAGEFDLAGKADYAYKAGAFVNGKVAVPYIGDIGLNATGSVNLTTGEYGGAILGDVKRKGTELGRILPKEYEGGVTAGVGWNNKVGGYWVGPYPVGQWTESGTGMANFRAGIYGQYSSKHDSIGLDVVDNAVLNTAVPLLQSPAQVVGTAGNYLELKGSQGWVDLRPGDWVVIPSSVPFVPPTFTQLTPQMQYDAAQQEIHAYQSLADDYRGWSDSGTQLSRAWDQGSGWVRRVGTGLWVAPTLLNGGLPGAQP
jgi:hypothetical protein